MDGRRSRHRRRISQTFHPSHSKRRGTTGMGQPRGLLLLRGDLFAKALFFLPELGSKFGAEILRLEYLTNLDFRFAFMGIGATLDPFDGLFPRPQLPQPES